MDFEIVLACDSQKGIALEGEDLKFSIPWNVPDDMKFFRDLTSRLNDDVDIKDKINAVIMGRRTADTLQKTLPNRMNIVITSTKEYRTEEGFISYPSLDAALNDLKDLTTIFKVFVIGGAVLADEAVKSIYCRAVNLTHISYDYSCNVKLSDDFVREIESENYDVHRSNRISYCKTLNRYVELVFTRYAYINREEANYLDIAQKIIEKGHFRQTRNATTYSLFGERLEFDLDNGFPLLTSKRMFTRGILEELLFFLRGETDTKQLEDKNIKIWHGNTTKEFMEQYGKNLEEYDMGPMYGFQWRHYNAPYKGCRELYDGLGIDQLKNVIDLLVNDPYSRRILMTDYNPEQVEQGVLYPCHGLTIQFYIEGTERIGLQMYQRSVDWGLGAPFNITSYAALLHIVVNLVNNHPDRKHKIEYRPGRLIMIFGDVHIYSDDKSDHIEPIKKQIQRRNSTYRFPNFEIKKRLRTLDDLRDLDVSDTVITNYRCHQGIKMSMIA